MSSAAAELVGELFPIVTDGIAVLARTTAGMCVLGVTLAGGGYFLAGGGWRGLAAVGLTFALAAVASVFVALKRAVLTVVRNAIVKVRLAERAVTLLFASSTLNGVAERIPLAQAEQMLRSAVQQLVGERAVQKGMRAWLARQAQARTVELVQRMTLAAFRREDQKSGGVDLKIVRDHLVATAQEQMVGRIDSMLTSVTALVCTVLTVISLGVAFLLRVK